jgi:uncharacterized protein (TIGR00725 family)
MTAVARSPSSARSAARPLAGRTISVFGSSTLQPDEPGWDLAESLGRALAQAGAEVMTGGYGGAMEAVSRGARAAGGHVVGVTVELFPERVPNRHLSERRHTATLLERLGVLLGADGFVALDGSVGTLAEFFLAWNHVMFEVPERRPLVCLGPGWAAKLAALRREGLVAEDRLFALVRVAGDPEEAVWLMGERKGAGS